ncbi:MAG: hypothetical protein J6Y92_04985 [Lentisphaeria bacterium]|nr:hypothetical protein [Lentisphaeria bacterium]
MTEPKQKKKRSPLRRLLKAVFWTAGILVFLLAFAFFAALFTIDRWIVPFGAWCADVEVEGEPGVIVSIANREILLTGLKVKFPDGEVEAAKLGFRVDDVKLAGRTLKEIYVSGVRAEGVCASLDFSRRADAAEGQTGEAVAGEEDERSSGEKVRAISRLVWDRASRPVVRLADLTVLDAEIGWQAGAVRSLTRVSDLNAKFEDGILTRPEMSCRLKYRLNDPQRFLECGARIRASTSLGGDGLVVSVLSDGPLVIEVPDSHLEIPASERTEIVMLYEPGTGALRFRGEWANPDVWEYSPLSLSLHNTLLEAFGRISLDGENLHLELASIAHGSDLVCRATNVPGNVQFEARGIAEFDLATGGVTLDSVSGYLTGPNGGRINVGTTGVFEFVRHEDATYTLNPHAAKLTVATDKYLDLTPFDPVLPFDSSGRELGFDYTVELDPEKVCLLGGAKAVFREHDTGRRIFDAEAAFETEGITRIDSFRVSRCAVAVYDGADKICGAQLAGKYNVRTVSLKGDVQYYPYRMIETYGDRSLADLCSFLDDADLSEAEHEATAELELDLINMAATLHKESHLSHLALKGSGQNNLVLDAIGDADFRLEPDDRGWQLDGTLELKAGDDFHARLSVSGGSESAVSGTAEIDRLSDVLARQLEARFFPGRDDLPVLRFVNATAAGAFQCVPETGRVTLDRMAAEIDGGDGSLSVQCGTGLTWEDGAFSCLPMEFTLKVNRLPVSFWEPFLRDDDFRFAGGVVTSEFDVTVSADGTLVGGTGKLVGTDLAVLLDGQPRELARLGANGSFQLNTAKGFLVLPELNVDIQDRQARQTLFASGGGTVDLADGFRTRMKFPEARFGPEALYLIGYGVERSFYFEELDTAGEIDFQAERDFSEMSWTGALRINRLRLQSDEPEEYRFPELAGRLEGGLTWVDGEMFGDVLIRLADETGEEHISGRYLYRRGEDALPKFISSSLDLPFSVSYFRYNHNTDPGVEKKAISLIDKTFELDLHGIYSRSHALIFSGAGLLELRDGDDPAILVPHAEFSGDVFGSASAEIHLKDGAWPFDVEADLYSIPLDKSFTAFLATDDNPEIPRRMHGFVKRLKAFVHGEGFTTEALTKNLRADCSAELEGISLRTYLRDRSLFLNILLLPLVSVPHLIDYVPGEMLRRGLRLTTAGAFMDMLSGDAPVEFRHGTMEMSVRQGVIDLKSLELEGELIEDYHASGTIDLAGDGEAELETKARIALLHWPFYLNGNILDPKVSYGKSISHFFTDNTKRLITLFPNMIINAFTDEEAEEIDRRESEKQERQKAEQEKK